MNWQKNTGVMPCDRFKHVSVKFASGTIDIGRASIWDWHLTGRKSDVTHYCILETPPFDYVEPKVWTAEWDSKRDCYVLSKNGNEWVMIDTIYTHKAEEIADALNAMEERNATH